jgi:hypothetical protein
LGKRKSVFHFFFYHNRKQEMEVYFFHVFAQTRKGYTGHDSVVDVCLDAMEEGSLLVTITGYVSLWEYYVLSVHQWARVCALLQRKRLPSRLVWGLQTFMCLTRRSPSERPSLVSEDSDAIAALTRIEFLWQDLDAVQAYLNAHPHCEDMKWVAAEVARRRQWFTGLRRAWLLAIVADDC